VDDGATYGPAPGPPGPGRRLTEDLGGGGLSRLGAVRVWVEVGALCQTAGVWGGSETLELSLPPGGELVLGSGPSAGGRIDDPTVSALHCRLIHTGHAVELTDLGARNGVRVGGVRITRAVLPPGAAFEIGRTLVRVAPRQGRDFIDVDDEPPLPGLLDPPDPVCPPVWALPPEAVAPPLLDAPPVPGAPPLPGGSELDAEQAAAATTSDSQTNRRPL